MEGIRMIVGIGVDVVEPARIAGMMERHGKRFLERTFTPDEIEYCQGRRRAAEHFAARWAAKEAVAKALKTGFTRRITWKDIEIVKEPGGAAAVRLHGKAETLAGRLGVSRIHLSITHTGVSCAAVAVLEKQ
jgi:holo-[acyl-carrier protein] synthase